MTSRWRVAVQTPRCSTVASQEVSACAYEQRATSTSLVLADPEREWYAAGQSYLNKLL